MKTSSAHLPGSSQGMDPQGTAQIMQMVSNSASWRWCHSSIPWEIRECTKPALSISLCKASFRETAWGGALSGVPCRGAAAPWSISRPALEPSTAHRPQTPNSSCLRGKFFPVKSQVLAQNKTHSNSCSGEAFNKKLNSMILKVFSNCNDFVTNLETHDPQFSPLLTSPYISHYVNNSKQALSPTNPPSPLCYSDVQSNHNIYQSMNLQRLFWQLSAETPSSCSAFLKKFSF